MIVLNGKYNFAKIFLPNTTDETSRYIHLDDPTHTQIESFLEHPAFKGTKIRIMPDVHFGKGSCVGFTMTLGDKIIPNIVGVDIGCGIMATNLGKIGIMSLKEFDDFVRQNVPAGFAVRKAPVQYYTHGHLSKFLELADDLELERNRVLNSIGTLGGGNHFIELGNDTDGNLWLTIHSGSRNLGLQVATFFQKAADYFCGEYLQDFGELNFFPNSSHLFNEYLDAMNIAQQFAHWNRYTMTKVITDGFFHTEPVEQIDSVHNYIDFNDHVIRKGATAANAGQKLVIPFNMEDGLIIGTGRGNKDWNNSAPHGAGRLLGRNAAKKSLDLEVARRGMEDAGVFTTSLSEATLDEAKLAYKPMDLILSMIQDTVNVDTMVRPIYNFKSK